MFDARTADRQLARYRARGPERTTALLLAALTERGVSGATALDIGGGVGALTLGLLRAGADRAVGVDASPAYVAAARSEAARQGYAERVTHRAGDVVALAGELDPAQIVTLDRVICCYPDLSALLAVAASRAQRFVGLVYPRTNWWLHAARDVINATCRLQRSTFRFFIHPDAAVAAALGAAGLRLAYHTQTALWQVALYERTGQ